MAGEVGVRAGGGADCAGRAGAPCVDCADVSRTGDEGPAATVPEGFRPVLVQLNMPFYPVERPWTVSPLLPAAAVDREAYVAALSREALSAAPDFADCFVPAVWVGGEHAPAAPAGIFRDGIAAHMADARLAELLRSLRSAFDLSSDPIDPDAPVEITLTVHPGMVSAATLDTCRIGHATRLWVDYGTASPAEARELGRFMGPEAMGVTKTVLGSARVDLAFRLYAGISGQTVRSAVASVEAALGYGATAVSLEPVELNPSSSLARDRASHDDAWRAQPLHRLPTPDERAEIVAAMEGRLRGEGFAEYLPGEWALPGHESRYLQLRAQGCDYLGFGLGARTAFAGVAAVNTADLAVYLRHSDDPARCIVERRPMGETKA